MEELISVLETAVPDVNYKGSDKLITDGIISSLHFVIIFSAISDYYKIEIPFEELIPENFDSLEAMLSLINKLSK